MFLGGLQSVLPTHAIHYRIARTTEAVLAAISRLPPRCGLMSNFVSDIAIFVLKRDVKLQLTNLCQITLTTSFSTPCYLFLIINVNVNVTGLKVQHWKGNSTNRSSTILHTYVNYCCDFELPTSIFLMFVNVSICNFITKVRVLNIH